jgi:hypothetical protein
MKKYKVIIWGLGTVGKSALDVIRERESLELVGVFDVDDKKVGRDAGEIFGYEKMGVTVNNNEDEVLALDADVVLYYPPTKWDQGKMPSPTSVGGNVDDIVKFLEAGKNCTSTLPVFFSEKNAPEYFERIDKAGKKTGATYVQQGIYPGILTPYFASLSMMFNKTIDQVIVYGGEDDAVNSAPWIAVFGFGKDPSEISEERLAVVQNIIYTYYGPTVIEIAERAGLDYDEYVCEHETILSDAEVTTPYAHVTPGTVGAHIFKMYTKKGDKEVTGFHFIHKASDDILPELCLDKYIEIKGEPDIRGHFGRHHSLRRSFPDLCSPRYQPDSFYLRCRRRFQECPGYSYGLYA